MLAVTTDTPTPKGRSHLRARTETGDIGGENESEKCDGSTPGDRHCLTLLAVFHRRDSIHTHTHMRAHISILVSARRDRWHAKAWTCTDTNGWLVRTIQSRRFPAPSMQEQAERIPISVRFHSHSLGNSYTDYIRCGTIIFTEKRSALCVAYSRVSSARTRTCAETCYTIS